MEVPTKVVEITPADLKWVRDRTAARENPAAWTEELHLPGRYSGEAPLGLTLCSVGDDRLHTPWFVARLSELFRMKGVGLGYTLVSVGKDERREQRTLISGMSITDAKQAIESGGYNYCAKYLTGDDAVELPPRVFFEFRASPLATIIDAMGTSSEEEQKKASIGVFSAPPKPLEDKMLLRFRI